MYQRLCKTGKKKSSRRTRSQHWHVCRTGITEPLEFPLPLSSALRQLFVVQAQLGRFRRYMAGAYAEYRGRTYISVRIPRFLPCRNSSACRKDKLAGGVIPWVGIIYFILLPMDSHVWRSRSSTLSDVKYDDGTKLRYASRCKLGGGMESASYLKCAHMDG